MYKEKKVIGFATDDTGTFIVQIEVRITADKIGKTLSLTYENVQFGIPLESVRDIVKIVK